MVKKIVLSDSVIWEVAIKTRAKDIAEGYAVLEKNQKAVLSFLQHNEINNIEIKMFSVSIEAKRISRN